MLPDIGQEKNEMIYMEANYDALPDIGQLDKKKNDQIVSQPEESFQGDFITYKGTPTDKLPTPVDNQTYNQTRDIEIRQAAEDPKNALPPKNFTVEERARFFDYRLLNTMKQSYDRINQQENRNYQENVNKKTAGEYLKEKGMTDEQLEEFGIYDPENNRYTGKFGEPMGEQQYSDMNMFLMSNGIDPEKRDKTWEDRWFYNNTWLGRTMASDTSYFWGLLKSVGESPGLTFRAIAGAEKVLNRGMNWGLKKVTGSEEDIIYTGHDNYWNQLADWSDKRLAEGLPDVPDDMVGGALQMLGHMAMFPAELYFTPATKLLWLSKYTGGALNKIPKLAYHLGGTTAMRTYNETDNLGQSLVEGARGFGDGVFLHMLGPISGRFGEMIGKTPIRQTFWAMGINSAGFGAKGATDELSRTGEWDWKRFGSDAMLGGMLAVPTLAKIADVYYTNTITTNRIVARMSLDKKQVMKKYNELQDIINNPNSTPAEKAHAQTGLQGIQNAIATRYAMMDVAQNPEIHRKAILNDKTLSEQEKQIQLDKIDDTVRMWESMQKGEKAPKEEPAKTETAKEKPVETEKPKDKFSVDNSPTQIRSAIQEHGVNENVIVSRTDKGFKIKVKDNVYEIENKGQLIDLIKKLNPDAENLRQQGMSLEDYINKNIEVNFPEKVKETKGKDLVKDAGIEDVYESKDGNSYVFFHYGDVKGPAMNPKAPKKPYTKDKRVYSKLDYYVDPLQKEGMIKSNQLNSVEVPKEKVYPFNKDPLNFTKKIKADLEKQNLEATPQRLMDNMHKYANEAGYDMIIAEWNGRYRAESTKPLEYTANPEVSKITSRNKAAQISELEQQAKDLVRLSKGKAKGPWEGTLLQKGLREAMDKHGDKAPEEIKTKWEEIQNAKRDRGKTETTGSKEEAKTGERSVEQVRVRDTGEAKEKNETVTLSEGRKSTKAERKVLKTTEEAVARDIKKGDQVVGNIVVDKKGSDLQVKRIDVESDYRKQGVAKESYRQLNRQAQENGGVLVSDVAGKINTEARRIWESLVKSKEAEKLEDGSYRMLPEKSTEKPNVVYTAQFVDKPEALTSEFKPRHENVIAHHATMEFKPTDPKVEPGKKGKVKVIGRVSDGKADALLIEGVESSNKHPHITLSVAEGTKPVYSNKMIEQAYELIDKGKMNKSPGSKHNLTRQKTNETTTVEFYKKPKEIDVTEGYFDGKSDVKTPIESRKELNLQNENKGTTTEREGRESFALRDDAQMKTQKDRAADKVAQGFDDLATAMGIVKKAEGGPKPDVLKAVKDIAEGIFELGVENVKDMVNKMKTRVSERYDEKTAAELYKVFDDNIKTIEKVYSEASKKRKFAEKLLKDPDVTPEIKEGMSIDSKEYVPKSLKTSEKDVELEIARRGVDEVYKMVVTESNAITPDVRVTAGVKLIRELNNRIKDKSLTEVERTKAEKDAINLAEFMTQYGTKLGRGVKAFHGWSLLNPVTMKKYMVDKIKENVGRELTEKELAEIDKLTQRVEEAYEGFDKQRAVTDLLKYQAQVEGVKWLDLAMSVWYANILSGFKTHELNFLANMANVAGELVTSTTHGLLTGNPKEGAQAFKGLLRGFSRGITEAANTLATGEAPVKGVKVDLTTNPNKVNPLEVVKFLKLWRYPGRMLSAVDAMFFYGLKDMRARELYYLEAKKDNLKGKEITEYIDRKLGGPERRRLALEKAASEGFEGRDQRRRAAEILDSQLPERLNQDMTSYASRGTFNYSPEGTIGKVTDLITHLVEGFELGKSRVKPLKFVIPFTRVLTNVANTYLDYSPYGFARAARGSIGGKGAADTKYRREYTPEERSKEYIKATMGTIAALSWLILSQHEDENGEKLFEITANGTGDYKKNFNLTSRNGWMPYSVKVRVGGKDRWFSYKNTPLAIPLSLIGTAMDYNTYRSSEISEEGFANFIGMLAWSSVQYFSDLTFLRGTSEFLSAFSEGEMGKKKFIKFIQNVGKGFVVPNLETQLSRQIQHWAQMPMKDAPAWQQKLYRDIPIARRGLNDMVNALGEPVIPDLSRWVNMDVEYNPIWDLIVKNEAWVTKPSRSTFTYNEEGEFVKLSDDEYYEYAKRRGELMKERITDQYNKLSKMDKGEVQEEIKKITTWAGKKAKKELRLGPYSDNKKR